MPSAAERQKAGLLKKAVQESRKRLGKNAQSRFGRFIDAYYANVPPQDIGESDPVTLFQLSHGHWKLGAARAKGKPLIRVFNPDPKKDGWRSDRTIIEIINDDMPFLVDSVTAELNRQNLIVRLVIHPILKVRRNKAGKLLDILKGSQRADDSVAESFMHLQVSQLSGRRLKGIETGIRKVLSDVRVAVKDWRPMRERLASLIAELETAPKGVPPEEAEEIREFLGWIRNNQFTLLGYREFRYKGRGKKTTVDVEKKSGLGILRDPNFIVFKEFRELKTASRDVREFIESPDLLLVTKTNQKSTIHRSVHMDAIGIKRFDARGRVIGQRLFVGLFTSVAYSRSPRDIPMLRRRLDKTLERAGFPSGSHDSKALMNILETFPRDELFQISDDRLFETSLGILHLQDRQRVALFIRSDHFERFMSCLIYVPRDRYSMALRHDLQDILCESFNGEVAAHHAELGDLPLARLHVIIRTTPGKIPPYDSAKIEARLIQASRSWSDRLSDALIEAHGGEKGLDLLHRYADAFDAGYRESHDGARTLQDIDIIEDVLATGAIGLHIYRPPEDPETQIRFKVFHPDRPIPLSDVLPLFEHMGFKVMVELEHEATIEDGEKRKILIHDFGLQSRDGSGV
ncbi:MAG: NAD-glutamate dehydrogenase, partial [Proteobacteria bacterium]|nr:NAD-glutamate dehydrogenase [Pseudomonadota bacterium]